MGWTAQVATRDSSINYTAVAYQTCGAYVVLSTLSPLGSALSAVSALRCNMTGHLCA